MNKYSRIVSIIFVLMVFWWGYIFVHGLKDTNQNFFYGAAQGVLPIVAAVFGILNTRKWGLMNSSMGKAVLLLSAGLITWGTGTLIFAYYNIVLNVEVPYPSLADAAYILSWPLWVIGMINLSRATGAKFKLKTMTGRLYLFLLPVILMVFSYYLLVVVAREGVLIESFEGYLKLFFDLAYPIGDLIILTIAILIYALSFNYLGGVFRWPILIILIGFSMNYFGDFTFVYTITKGTYFVGNWVDLIYTTTMFMLGLGVVLLDPMILHKDSK